jgi:hypothetical protein
MIKFKIQSSKTKESSTPKNQAGSYLLFEPYYLTGNWKLEIGNYFSQGVAQ